MERYILQMIIFQSTLPTRGSDCISCCLACCIAISIHAPHEGERREYCLNVSHDKAFQSTLPTRGSDGRGQRAGSERSHFNPRSPRGGATRYYRPKGEGKWISIHAPHEGERQRKSAFVCSISANLLNIIHCGTVTRCIAPQDCIIQAFFGAKKRCFYVRLCFALKNKGVRG